MAENGRQSRVLVVEDSYLMSDALSELLRDYGMVPVGPAGTLARAMTLASTETIDIALIDMVLRRESSVPLCRLLMARRTPFIIVTGSKRDLPADLDTIPVVMKPYVPAHLIGSLEGLLR